ncbi:MAG: hypothetical protein M1480_05820 [Bacteroidetes bacterium]|nr:hypothetical protein [Bacteroidota bacterium]
MKWHFIDTGFNSGKFNMAFDMALTRICKPDEAFLRFYRWEPYCISLGANQNINSINEEKAFSDSIDIVKRPTGGRAILHAEELTYSVIIPLDAQSSAKNIYQEINFALSEGLAIYDDKLRFVELHNEQPNFRDLYKEDKSVLCFAAPAKSELKYDGRKLVGSAQRKLGNVILQHGSILCGEFHKRIVDYLVTSPENYSTIYELLDSTADIKSITNKEINYDDLSESIVEGFESYYKMKFETINKEEKIFDTNFAE